MAELRGLEARDRAPLERILESTGAFSGEEISVALELIDLGIAHRDSYRFVVAEEGGQVAGYACYGLTPCTEGVYDLYWIAVDPKRQGLGLGRSLMAAAEEAVRRSGGRMVLVETASKPSYAATRAFYEGIGYAAIARVPDFYRPGDDKIIYGKHLR